MKKLIYLLVLAVMVSGSINYVSYGETFKHNEKVKHFGGINENQPLSVGEYIYSRTQQIVSDFRLGSSSGTSVVNTVISYTYVGIEDNNIRLQREDTEHSFRDIAGNLKTENAPEKITILTLPLNANRQTAVKVRTLVMDEPWLELLITVSDDFNRIKVRALEDK
jgi:hypothetical protein